MMMTPFIRSLELTHQSNSIEFKIDPSIHQSIHSPQNAKALSVLLTPDTKAIEELYQRVDAPLQYATDEHFKNTASSNLNSPTGIGSSAKKRQTYKYILSDHNRDGDSYRSPFSNQYYPPIDRDGGGGEEPFQPKRMLRELEIQANEVFDAYRQLYYGKDSDDDNNGDDGNASVSSVYLWNKEGGSIQDGFAGCFLIQKNVKEERALGSSSPQRSQSGYWNSIHVVDVNVLSGGKAKYEVSTTVLLSIDLQVPSSSGGGGSSSKNGVNTIRIGGSLSKQVEKILPLPSAESQYASEHISNIGQIIEDSEIELRSNLDVLYIQKTKEVLNRIRCDSMGMDHRKHGIMAAVMGGGVGAGGEGGGNALQNEMQAALKARLMKRS